MRNAATSFGLPFNRPIDCRPSHAGRQLCNSGGPRFAAIWSSRGRTRGLSRNLVRHDRDLRPARSSCRDLPLDVRSLGLSSFARVKSDAAWANLPICIRRYPRLANVSGSSSLTPMAAVYPINGADHRQKQQVDSPSWRSRQGAVPTQEGNAWRREDCDQPSGTAKNEKT